MSQKRFRGSQGYFRGYQMRFRGFQEVSESNLVVSRAFKRVAGGSRLVLIGLRNVLGDSGFHGRFRTSL